MSILALLVLAAVGLALLCLLPMLISMAFEMLPLIIAIVLALAIYGWLT